MSILSRLKTAKKNTYYGWWIVLVTGLVSGLGSGFYLYGISVFFKDITAELGTGRAITSLGSSIGRMEGGIISPLTGWMGDRFGPRWLIFGGVLLLSLGMGLMYTVTSVWTYFVVWGLITGLGLNLGLTVAVDLALTNWFVRKRGLALGIKFVLIGIGAIIAVPAVTWLVNLTGWRMTCLIWSLVMLVCLPLVLLVVKSKRPEYYGLQPDGTPTVSPTAKDAETTPENPESGDTKIDYTFKQAIRTRTYWVIVLSYALFAFVSGGLMIHSVPLLTDIGLSETAASAMLSLMVFFTLPSRFMGGVIADRISRSSQRWLLAAMFGLMLIGIGSFVIQPISSRVLFLLVPYGLSSGAVTPVMILIIGRYFGRKSFGAIFGSCIFFNAIPQLISPVYAGWIYDVTGSYVTALYVFAAMAAVSTVAILFATNPPLPEKEPGAAMSSRAS